MVYTLIPDSNTSNLLYIRGYEGITETRLLKYIDPYSDTIFNFSTQIPDVLKDFNDLIDKNHRNNESLLRLREIIKKHQIVV